MKYIWLLILLGVLSSCKDKKSSSNSNVESSTEIQDVSSKAKTVKLDVYNFNDFKNFLNKANDTTYVINFWATWCAPCVKELPYFEKLNQKYIDKKVKVILVSLDFPHLYDSKLKPFIVENHLKSKVIALDDVDMNAWIPQIDKDWSGSIPATIIYKNKTSKFFEQSFTYELLEVETLKILNK
ncbi:thiol-disulfide oxidoreductase [Yeosuana aromativorans]|uniref:Thiol-disulfide oxidoreductase n=1 Tax=Yeosuana aromativorans TaxID=288019 RepID=A0A8J3FJY3_9FLAO|nr:TlpA disulfide reductase family protein [Yeosuana aromativorans]GGK25789.1 thiol-disulfide oxidoreductase [Yeosuana aromativorans]